MNATWTSYRSTIGDRSGLFAQIHSTWNPRSALYPGSYVDLSPSTAIASVTYVDTDRRAARFFADRELVAAELAGRTLPGAGREVDFIAADYTQELPLADASVDLLISFFAGPFWENCRRYLAPSGLFLANTSHGDASLAALDPEVQLVAAVHSRPSKDPETPNFRLDTQHLDRYLVPKKPAAANAEAIRAHGRGIAYTATAFAYLFQRRCEAAAAKG